MSTPQSIIGALLELHAADPSATLVLDKRRGLWRERSRDELLTEVARLTEGLCALDLPSDATVLMVAEDGVVWVAADLAVQAAGLRVCAIPADGPTRCSRLPFAPPARPSSSRRATSASSASCVPPSS
jgi:long-subunit acyl-CoA synthetase (AMP-forming)